MHHELRYTGQAPTVALENGFEVGVTDCSRCNQRVALRLPDVPADCWHLGFFEIDADESSTLDVLAEYSAPPKSWADTLVRLQGALLGRPGITPTRQEYWIHVARSVAARSSSTRSRVGAVVVRDDSLLAAGTNELPRGVEAPFWGEEGTDDCRDFRIAGAPEPTRREAALSRFLDSLDGWPPSDSAAIVPEEFETSELFELLDVERSLHAEVAAILDAARRGVAVAGADLFVTHEPCYRCRRAAAGAGVKELYFQHPRPQRLTAKLASELGSPVPARQVSGIVWSLLEEARRAIGTAH